MRVVRPTDFPASQLWTSPPAKTMSTSPGFQSTHLAPGGDDLNVVEADVPPSLFPTPSPDPDASSSTSLLPVPPPPPPPSLMPTLPVPSEPLIHVPGAGSLTIACFNLGGPSITKERFGNTILALRHQFPDLPKVVSLSEFKPTGASLHEFQWMAQVASQGQYHLLPSVDPQGKNGVALLIHQDLSPNGPPKVTIVHEARVLAFSTKIHSDPTIPSVTFVAVYGSCLPRDRPCLQQSLSPFFYRAYPSSLGISMQSHAWKM